MVYVILFATGISAGLAVFFGFKATEKNEKESRSYYVKLTALLTGLSVVLLGLLCMS